MLVLLVVLVHVLATRDVTLQKMEDKISNLIKFGQFQEQVHSIQIMNCLPHLVLQSPRQSPTASHIFQVNCMKNPRISNHIGFYSICYWCTMRAHDCKYMLELRRLQCWHSPTLNDTKLNMKQTQQEHNLN